MNTLALSPQVLAILDVFADDPRRRSTQEIAERTSIPHVTAHWLCQRLADRNVLHVSESERGLLFRPSMHGRRVIADRQRLAGLCPIL